MRRRLSHTVISFLLILVVSLGTALAGIPECPSDCPECAVVPACCVAMAENPAPGTSKPADHLPGRTTCSHDGICFDGFQSIDLFSVTGSFQYDSALVQSHRISEVHQDPLCRTIAPILPQSPLEKFPPLYLRNCSFLI